MNGDNERAPQLNLTRGPLAAFADVMNYWQDAWQRSVLYLDVMQKRADQYREHAASDAPHVLNYQAELVVDGRTLERPVNYALVRIVPPQGVVIDQSKRPFVVIDPRAGHGPGIGGFKSDSEIGVAMKAGHPCYFIGFLPEPMPGQTIWDIAAAEAQFLETIISRHPDADGKPCVIGNCQAGWAVMILAALRPELFGPIIIAGSPLSYWAGVHGKNPMRYLGGLLGGSWLTAMTGDLGAGKFDGAWLVQNFENQNPANTLWTKQFNLYSKVDTEAERYLEFERWWGGHVLLNAEEMQFIVDELFVGNKLAAGEISAPDGTQVDLRSIRSPIVVFCSQGDNITPPQQALDWILDLYEDVDDIRAHGQTIVYSVHAEVGHLGIFVSGGVARKEHDEFASNIDLIDVLPPGLYEAVFEPKAQSADNSDLVTGEWILRCEERTLDDIRALGGNSPEDERRFDAAARLSEINLALYRTFAQPFVRMAATPQVAEAARRMHPLRLQYEMCGSSNPFMAWVGPAANFARQWRTPAASDGHWTKMQDQFSRQITTGLDQWRQMTERASEDLFLAFYGLPALQAALGIDPDLDAQPRKAAKHRFHAELLERRIKELKSKISEGGVREAVVRALIFAGMARKGVDERSFEVVRRMRRSVADGSQLSLAQFKALVREQYLMLLIDEEAALQAIPSLLPAETQIRKESFAAMESVLEARGEIGAEVEGRIERLRALFGLTKSVTSGTKDEDTAVAHAGVPSKSKGSVADLSHTKRH
jgi:hypothetical protein